MIALKDVTVLAEMKRKIEGPEKEHLLTIFRLIDPVNSSNNQRSFTEIYNHAGKTYMVYYWDDEIDIIEFINEKP